MDYNIFLPEFSSRILNESVSYLGSKGLICEVNPKFKVGKKPPLEDFLLLSLEAPELAGWPLKNETIVTGFDIKVDSFSFKNSESSQAKKLDNLFGLVKKDKSILDISTIKSNESKETISKLKKCKKEITITEKIGVFGSDIVAPMFLVALAIAGDGLIYEGEFMDYENFEDDFWPETDEIEELKEDLDDGMRPQFFMGW